jgi:hypothetical protein
VLSLEHTFINAPGAYGIAIVEGFVAQFASGVVTSPLDHPGVHKLNPMIRGTHIKQHIKRFYHGLEALIALMHLPQLYPQLLVSILLDSGTCYHGFRLFNRFIVESIRGRFFHFVGSPNVLFKMMVIHALPILGSSSLASKGIWRTKPTSSTHWAW